MLTYADVCSAWQVLSFACFTSTCVQIQTLFSVELTYADVC
jgi:hypothetical protein